MCLSLKAPYWILILFSLVLLSEASLIPKPIEEFIQKHKKEKHRRASVPTVVNQISTGTVTESQESLDSSLPNEVHADYDCNEIMAKALVRASEEKEMAFVERDQALLEAQNAEIRAEALDKIAQKAVEDSEKLNADYNALKVETDRLLHEMENQTKMEIGKVMADMKEELALKEKEWLEEKTKMLQSSEDLVREYESAKDQSVSALTVSYGKEMENMKRTFESEIFILKDEMEKIQASYTEYKDFVHKKMKSAQEKFHQDVENVKKEYEKEIVMMKDQVETMKVALKIREEANREGSFKHQELITQLQNKIANLQQQVETVKEEAFYWSQLHDQQGYFNMTLIEQDALILIHKTLDELKKGSVDTIAKASIKFNDFRSTAAVESKEMFAQLLKNSKLLWSKVNVATKPQQEIVRSLYAQHLASDVDSFLTEIKSFYNQYLAETIEGSMMEANSFHEKYVVSAMEKWVKPFYRDHIKPAKEKMENEYIIPGRMKMFLWMHKLQSFLWVKAVHTKVIFLEFAKSVFERTCKGVENLSSNILEWLQSKPSTPTLLVSLMLWISSHSQFSVQFAISLTCAFCIFKLRRVCYSLSIWLALAPFRLVWYASPLRLITSKDDEDEEGIIGRKLDSDSNFVLSVKKNGSPVPKKASLKKFPKKASLKK